MDILNTLMTASKDAVHILDENKEKILLVSGIAAGAGATVLACRATLKAKDAIEVHKEVKTIIDTKVAADSDYAGSAEYKKDIITNCANTGVQLAKMYAPSVILGATSVCCLVAQHKLMENKVVKLEETVASVTAAYIAVDTAFKKYRKRVVDKYGQDVDKQLLHGETTETVTETDLNTGKTKKVKKTYVESPEPSEYSKFFDDTSSQFLYLDPQYKRPDWDANIRFLVCQQAFANQKLESQGYLFLNDVYEMIGIPKTKAGQVVGWIFDPENPDIDSHIDFGTFDIRNRRTINGLEEECLLLDFNVDGVIIDQVCGMADH